MKIKYSGTDRLNSIKDIFESIFSIHYYDYDVTPKAISLTILNREWYWQVGEWPEEK
jgi:hypothetical protein